MNKKMWIAILKGISYVCTAIAGYLANGVINL